MTSQLSPVTSQPSPPLRLHSLRGRESKDLAEDLRHLSKLPRAAQERLWDVLAPALSDPIPREAKAVIDRFAQEHQVATEDLAPALRGCRALIRAASTLDVGEKQLAQDLERLSDDAESRAVLLRGYDRAKNAVRSELAQRSLAEQGRLLEGIHWRIDSEWSSDRVMGLRMPVVTLTLRYREGETRGQITLQVLPDVLRQIASLCDRILPKK